MVQSWKIMEKSWNCVFEFLWGPCNLEILTCDPSIYKMSHPKFIVSNQKEEPICTNRFKEILLDILGILAEENAQDDPGLVPVRAAFFPSLTFLGVQVFIIYESFMNCFLCCI